MLRAAGCSSAACSSAARHVQAVAPSLLRPTRALTVAAAGTNSRLDSSDASSSSRTTVSSTNPSSSTATRPVRTRSSKPLDFFQKVTLAWRIFFPEEEKLVTPKEEVKKRLKMVLVADRCGMSPASLSEMKKNIVKALQEYVDIEGEEGIEVAITTEPGLGTVYSVNIPVRRVKPQSRFGPDLQSHVPDGITLEWDDNEFDQHQAAARFPMGC